MTHTIISKIENKVVKEVFEIYKDEKYRLKFKIAEQMTEDMIKIALYKQLKYLKQVGLVEE